jgi:hypothetical protein
MPIVKFSDLYNHRATKQYELAFINAHTLPSVSGIINCAAKLDAPIVLTVHSDSLKNGLLPSIEMLIRQANIPVAWLAKHVKNVAQAVQAIRLGCNGLILDNEMSEPTEISKIAESCGIEVVDMNKLHGGYIEIDEELELANLRMTAQMPSSWNKFNDLITETVANYLENYLIRAAGNGQDVLETYNTWHPVEHLIIYNTSTDDLTTEKTASEGLRILDKISGVKATWHGRSVKPDAKYKWCWLVRFVHQAVIDSYREHPDHVQYADNYFRPVASDRISIDYELTSAEERQIYPNEELK